MGMMEYDQSIKVGQQQKVIKRKEYFGEDSLWHKFKLGSAVFLWLLCLVLIIAGGVWFYGHFYFNGPPPTPTSSTTTTVSSVVVPPPAPPKVVVPPVIVSPPLPSVIKVEVPKIELEVKLPPAPVPVPIDPTENLTPGERRQRQIWRHE